MKTCTTCHETKSLNQFHNHPGGKDGKQSQCIACRTDYQRRHRTNLKLIGDPLTNEMMRRWAR